MKGCDRHNIETAIITVARKIHKKISRRDICAMHDQLSELLEQLDIEIMSEELADNEFAE